MYKRLCYIYLLHFTISLLIPNSNGMQEDSPDERKGTDETDMKNIQKMVDIPNMGTFNQTYVSSKYD